MKHERTMKDLELADKVVLATGAVFTLLILGMMTFGPYMASQKNVVKTEMTRGISR